MMEESVPTIFVGKKPFMNYVTGVVLQFNSGAKKVLIKARGKYISRAVDVAEVTRNKFLKDVKLESIKIGSEEFDSPEGRKIRVSTIEIALSKP
ncbi:DNA-binding protein Alba [Nanoarchaeota archaeon]|nr:MAG: DNA-binding protein Alba [Nanoarchaeota archaeon]